MAFPSTDTSHSEESDSSANPSDVRVGRRLRMRRKTRRLTLGEVANATGISISQLSLIERGLASPSVKGLREICHVLDISISWLFEEEDKAHAEEKGLIVRSHLRLSFDLSAKKMHKEMLTPEDPGKLQFIAITMQKGGASGIETYSHEGEETGLVQEGRMELQIGKRVFLLEEGDSFRFDSSQEHRFANAGDAPCRVLWICTPPFY